MSYQNPSNNPTEGKEGYYNQGDAYGNPTGQNYPTDNDPGYDNNQSFIGRKMENVKDKLEEGWDKTKQLFGGKPEHAREKQLNRGQYTENPLQYYGDDKQNFADPNSKGSNQPPFINRDPFLGNQGQFYDDQGQGQSYGNEGQL